MNCAVAIHTEVCRGHHYAYLLDEAKTCVAILCKHAIRGSLCLMVCAFAGAQCGPSAVCVSVVPDRVQLSVPLSLCMPHH